MFSSNFFIATSEKSLELEEFSLRRVVENNGNLNFLFHADNRSSFFSSINELAEVIAIVDFPLTREKFKFKGSFLFSKESLLTQSVSQQEEWEALTNEEKLAFEWFAPDTEVSEIKDEMNIYTAQEGKNRSANFETLLLVPCKVELTRTPAPQVVANSRKPDYESLMKLHKTKKKFVFELQNKDWSFREVNP